jgi:hypothetical protein
MAMLNNQRVYIYRYIRENVDKQMKHDHAPDKSCELDRIAASTKEIVSRGDFLIFHHSSSPIFQGAAEDVAGQGELHLSFLIQQLRAVLASYALLCAFQQGDKGAGNLCQKKGNGHIMFERYKGIYNKYIYIYYV